MEVDARDPWEELRDIERQERALHARRLEAIARLDSEWPEDPSVPDLSRELAGDLGWSQCTAFERIRAAAALRDLPELRRAEAEGRLSENQLRWVTRFATPETDRQWAERAWTRGGPTSMDDLVMPCGRHHRMQHQGGWSVRGRPPDPLEFVDRRGRVMGRDSPVLRIAG